MKWIKASERLPKMEKSLFLKLDGETMAMGNFYEQDQSYMLYIQRNGAHEEYEKPYHAGMNIEWLNESQPPASVEREVKDNAIKVLAELVRLKIIKDELDEVEQGNQDQLFVNKYAQYKIDKFKAWDSAKKLLSTPQTEDKAKEYGEDELWETIIRDVASWRMEPDDERTLNQFIDVQKCKYHLSLKTTSPVSIPATITDIAEFSHINLSKLTIEITGQQKFSFCISFIIDSTATLFIINYIL